MLSKVVIYFIGYMFQILLNDCILGELQMEDEDDPENPFHLTAGDVILVDEGTVSQVSTQSKARGELIATQ